jgi:nitric oxide reductase large subunit
VRTSREATSYLLVYGIKAMILLEVEIPSLKVLMKAELKESKWAKLQYIQLHMIIKIGLVVICHNQLCHRTMPKVYDKKFHFREFKEGDLVLRKIMSIPGEDQSK